jgi:hypothetical protein
MKKNFKLFHFEIYHFIIILIVVVISQLLIPVINSFNTKKLIDQVMDYYRWDVAERMADQTTTSLELLFQRVYETSYQQDILKQATIEAIDIIIYQENLQRNVEDFFIILGKGNNIRFYNTGGRLFEAVFNNKELADPVSIQDKDFIIDWYKRVSQKLYKDETIQYTTEQSNIFLFLVPFSVKGEVSGAVYMKINPKLEDIERAFISSFRQTGALFSILIFLGILAMFVMTNYIINERDVAQEELYKKKALKLTKDIENQKENMFVQRIYHAHHKVEKIIGFVKQDLLKWPDDLSTDIKGRINKYINFIGRVIYSMKTINPPISVNINPNFKTNVNEVLIFIVQHIFRRVYKEGQQFKFETQFDDGVPIIHINEFVMWEICEPIINNAIDHNKSGKTIITITTVYIHSKKMISIQIKDNGIGIDKSLLKVGKDGVKIIFNQHSTTKKKSVNSGNGCYIAYENCKRCGWQLDADNNSDGAIVTINIPV